MRTHSHKGCEIIDSMLKDHGLDSFENINILRNIAEFHHEAVNGTGYPNGLQGTEIPLEARIVAVADVFDALTSKRPTKKPGATTMPMPCCNALLAASSTKNVLTHLSPTKGK